MTVVSCGENACRSKRSRRRAEGAASTLYYLELKGAGRSCTPSTSRIRCSRFLAGNRYVDVRFACRSRRRSASIEEQEIRANADDGDKDDYRHGPSCATVATIRLSRGIYYRCHADTVLTLVIFHRSLWKPLHMRRYDKRSARSALRPKRAPPPGRGL